jgi:glycosyltransferase involved in cell wall biosynthesis
LKIKSINLRKKQTEKALTVKLASEVEVSILMPVKNTAKFLEECLNSILTQTIWCWELIAVDDYSTDNSFSILDDYAKKDSRIKVFKNNDQGIIGALRLAYKHSNAQFITRMDSDDIMERDKLELLVNGLKKVGEGYISVGLVNYFSQTTIGEGYANYANWLNNLTKSTANFSDIYKECSIPSPCWMVQRNDFEACGGFGSDLYPEDYDLAFRFRKAGLKISTVPKVIHQWRDYETRTSRTDENYTDNRFAELKVMHFLDQDYDAQKSLVVWGAGRKGKKIASLLIDKEVHFQWVCNNPNKIGKDIYGTYLRGMPALADFESAQVIIAISSPRDKEEIEQMISEHIQHQYFRFY